MANLLWLNMEHRYLGPESIDDPNFSGEKLRKILRHLAWINKLLGNHTTVREKLFRMASDLPRDKPLRVVDLGCGGGDLISYLDKRAQKEGLSMEFVGIDKNPNTLQFARDRTAGNDRIQFIEADIKSSDFLVPPCDFLISSHFIYHFGDIELKRFLMRNMQHVSRGLVFIELRRSRTSYRLFFIFGPLFFPGNHTVSDGLIAIRRAFTTDELKRVIHTDWPEVKIQSAPFFRICITLNVKSTN